MKPGDIEVIFEDNHLLALVKPAGLLVQGDRSGHTTLLDQARAYLKAKYSKPGRVYLGLVHRLDRPVSGIVLLARTSKAAGRLSREFREGRPRKTYLAVVCGQPVTDGAEICGYLAKKSDRSGRTPAGWEAFPEARESRLTYRVIERGAEAALLEVRPVTGRRHQIRAQLAMIGHPILGDVKYGAPERLPGRRIALHASRLVLAHPIRPEDIDLRADPPAEWPWPWQAGMTERSGP